MPSSRNYLTLEGRSNVDSPQTVISFCTGYGGIELGLRRAGVDVFPIVYLENEAFCQANLVEKMETGAMAPAPIWSDLKTFDPQPFRGMVDGCIGGYPCQPFSSAGKRAGEKDPRHLWPHIREHVRSIRPVWCFFENVQGHITLGLRNVIEDLVGLGYRTTWGIFSAEETGAPHQRKRVFILAHSPNLGQEWSSRPNQKSTSHTIEGCGDRSPTAGKLAHTKDGRGKPTKRERGQSAERGSADRGGGPATGQETSEELADSDRDEQTEERGDDGEVLEVSQIEGQKHSPTLLGGGDTDTGGEPTRWPARPGEEQHEWEEPRVTEAEPKLGGATNGASSGVDPNQYRVDRLRLLGNGVVPQTAELAWKTLWKEMNQKKPPHPEQRMRRTIERRQG